MKQTLDRYTVIEEQSHNYVRYRCVTDKRRWEVFGKCVYNGSTHGPCQDGAIYPDIGPPESRLDNPIAPTLKCSLCVDNGHITFKELRSFKYRIIIPALDFNCVAALAMEIEDLLPEVWVIDKDDDFAYGKLLDFIWNQRVSFCLVEHDIVPWPDLIRQLFECSCDFCGHNYLLGKDQLGSGLGCVKFSSELIKKTKLNCKNQLWNGLDGFIRIKLGEYHQHLPSVGHAPIYARD